MSREQLQKKQAQNPQPSIQADQRQGQRMGRGQMPPLEDALTLKKKTPATEIGDIETKLMDLSMEEFRKEEELKNMKPVLENLCRELMAAQEEAEQNPESEQAKQALSESKKRCSDKQNEAGLLIKSLFNLKQEKLTQLEKHEAVIMKQAGREITDEWRYQVTVESLEKRMDALQEYTQEPWKDCFGSILGTMEKLKNMRDGFQERLEHTKTARKMEQDAKGYSHKTQMEGWKSLEMSGEDMIHQYQQNIELLWENEDRRKTMLSPEYITQHIRESFYFIDYALFFRSEKQRLRIPEAERASVERADRIMEYYRKHVQNVLNDYGMDFKNMHYDKKKIETMAEEGKMNSQVARWEKDAQTYEELTADSDWELLLENTGFADERLLSLEHKLGIAEVKVETEEKIQEGVDVETFMEQHDGYYRYRSNILDNMACHKNAAGKKSRLLLIGETMVQKLQAQGLWRETSSFTRILEYLRQDRQNLEEMNTKTFTEYENREKEIRGNLKKALFRTLRTASSALEKQYVAELCTCLKKEQEGDLILPENPGSVLYREDRHLKDSAIVSMKSVKDQPLFPHDPTLKDFSQGAIGDCFFMATIVSLVARSPGKIKEIMKDNMDGTVTVRFYDRDQQRYFYVKVDKTIPERIGESGNIADRAAVGALWIKMLEKAYASVRNNDTRRLSNRSGGWSYVGAWGGFSHEALEELTGIKGKIEWMDEKDFSMFKGRLDKTKLRKYGETTLDTMSLLYYEDMHTGDREAFHYLEGRGVPRRRKAELKAELERNKKVEELLEKVMLQEAHEMEIDVMDKRDFTETMMKACNRLNGYITTAAGREGHTLKLRDLAQTNIPESMRKLFTECWNLCGKKAENFRQLALGMVASYIKNISISGTNLEQYTEREEELYQKIKNILDKKGYCGLGTRNFKVEGEQIQLRGTSGESYLNGIFAGHAYAVLRTEVHKVGNKTKKFLRIKNPHGVHVPLYRLENDGRLKRVGFIPDQPDQEDNAGIYYQNYTHGVFLMELRDARNFFKAVYSSL